MSGRTVYFNRQSMAVYSLRFPETHLKKMVNLIILSRATLSCYSIYISLSLDKRSFFGCLTNVDTSDTKCITVIETSQLKWQLIFSVKNSCYRFPLKVQFRIEKGRSFDKTRYQLRTMPRKTFSWAIAFSLSVSIFLETHFHVKQSQF